MVSDRLKELLEKEGIKQKELAKQIGMHPSKISSYANGTNPSSEFFYAMYKRGVNVHWLLSGEGDMYLTPKTEENLTIETGKKDPFLALLYSIFGRLEGRYRDLAKPLMDELEAQEKAKNK